MAALVGLKVEQSEARSGAGHRSTSWLCGVVYNK